MTFKNKHSGRTLIIASLIGIGLIGGAAAWRTHRDADPVIQFPPAPVLPSPNAYDSYAKAGDMHAALAKQTPNWSSVDYITDSTPPRGLTPQQLAKRYPIARKEAWLRTNASVLSTLRQGFKHSYRWDYTAPNEFSQGSKVRSLARLLMIESNARGERGDWKGASQSALDIFHMGYDTPRGGPYYSALLGYAFCAMGQRSFETIVPNLDAPASRKAAATLERMYEKRVPIAEVLEQEKWHSLKSLLDFLHDPEWRGMGRSSSIHKSGFSFGAMVQSELVSKRSIVDAYTNTLDQVIASARLPYSKRVPIVMPTDPISQVYIAVYDENSWAEARAETGTALLYVSLALRAFKLEKGHYPEKLAELTPSYIKKVPADPFGGGEPMRYRRTDKSYLLYSIGPDGKDDGGKQIDDKKAKNVRSRRLIKHDSVGDAVSPYTPQ
jgi:hypothetical protein